MNSDWDKLKHLFKRQEVPAKTTLLQEGQISRTMFFIEKGCLRTWVNNDGKDITTQFFFEGDRVASIESFRTKQPSLYSIESLEPCILQTISQQDFQSALQNLPEIKKELEEHLFRRLLHTQKLFYSYLKNNHLQRYQELIVEHPHIIQRIPQHYIASYLGVTTVHLSRIKGKIAREKK
ncbi:cAMP-binding domain of CRP or a regulatory subunit of cAMP-dependent protein kinases [Chryseobacterium soldanellicola]|uniref:cAMP-binding domain of CRP or a regulatory subunit of cAMP-dependent protein kinases n=1 Tax=Chryseobacterium soldanellicola TaxID=311333 RepID=A0A1H1FT46_9FLAO|nr:Crp/Fnr family transcriptional regulator [Chryseobacterium soldanellicola]SDR04104.1 cAMP-binding domain of CRP or a regulatory subunit of cAMP-dependent protein kinases [Chryseobacterium soldanellicola]